VKSLGRKPVEINEQSKHKEQVESFYTTPESLAIKNVLSQKSSG
jgi:hypothetical protein